MIGETEFRVNLLMTFHTRSGVTPRIVYKDSFASARFDVQASWPMTGFTTRYSGPFLILNLKPRVRAGWEGIDDIDMAI